MALRFTLAGLAVAVLVGGCGGQEPGPSRVDEPATPAATETPTPTTVAAPRVTETASPVAEQTPNPTPAVGPGSQSEPAQLLREGRFEDASAAYSALASAAADPGSRTEALVGAGVAEYERGNHDSAIESLQSAVDGAPPGTLAARRAAYLLAVRQQEAGRPAEAAAALRPFALAGVSDPLQPYILVQYGKVASAAGDVAGATAAWEALDAMAQVPPKVRIEAKRGRLEAARDTGDQAIVFQRLQELLAIASEPGLRYELAEMARSAGDMSLYGTSLQAIVADSPASRYAVLAIADLRAAGYAVDAGRAGLAYYRQRAYPEAKATLLDGVAEPGIAAGDLAFRLFYLAATYEDTHSLGEAVATYDRAAAADPTSPFAYRARYWAARTTETMGDSRSASARYLELARDYPTGQFAGEAAFRSGYSLLQAGDPAAAITTWDGLDEPVGDARLLYWKGRAYQLLGDGTNASAAFARGASVAPLSFYGAESGRVASGARADVRYRARTAAPPPDWNALAEWLNGRVPGTLASQATVAPDLMAMGLRDEATQVLLDASGGAGAWTLLALARQAHELGLSDVAARLATRLASATGAQHEMPVDLERLAYPLDYVKTLNDEGLRNNLDPLFVAAMVRQESFWDPSAGSSAGAMGLTQVIPSTGEAIANALGVASFAPSDLFRPAISLRFGAYYLGGQVRRFGDPYAALAAYNAGPGAAGRWVGVAGGAPAPDFVEAIDFSETHDYVERVMDHYAHYLHAYGG
jgi:soluble lytic murein transglycosylase